MAPSRNEWTPDPGLLAGQVALIAGGAGGIGDATSRVLAAAGASVVIADRELEAGERLAAELAEAGGSARAIEVDLMDEAACAAMVDRAVTAFGGIDILANVAGGLRKHAPWAHLAEWTTENWDAIFDLNLRYVFWVCRAAIPVLQARGGGAIVNITSINGTTGNPNQSAYGAAKAGLINLTQTLAGECGPLGIRVNAVSPGMTLTAGGGHHRAPGHPGPPERRHAPATARPPRRHRPRRPVLLLADVGVRERPDAARGGRDQRQLPVLRPRDPPVLEPRRPAVTTEADRSDLERRLRSVLDRQEIHDALVRYCRGIDRCDERLVLSAFHADAMDNHTGSDQAEVDRVRRSWPRPAPRCSGPAGTRTRRSCAAHLPVVWGDGGGIDLERCVRTGRPMLEAVSTSSPCRSRRLR